MFHKDGKKCACSMIGYVLVIIGAINLGLVGVGNFLGSNWNVVNLIFGNWMWLENGIYVLIGLAGILLIAGCKCKSCRDTSDKPQQ